MEQFWSWPLDRLVWVLLGTVVVLLGTLALLALRAPVLWKLGTRNLVRRPLRAALIVFGLLLGTTVVGTAFGAGDTMTYSLQGLVTGSLGSVDEVIVQNPPRTRGLAALRTFTQPGLGALAGANLNFFSEAAINQLSTSQSSTVIAGILPAIISQATVVHPESQQLQQFPLLAIPQPDPQAFGALTTTAGQPVVLTALAADEVVLNAAGATVFDAQVGDALTLTIGSQMWNVHIGTIVRNEGLVGLEPLVIVPLQPYQRLVNHPNEVNQLLVANRGGTASVGRSAEATRALRVQLVDRDVAQELHDLLAQPSVQRSLLDIAGNLQAADRERLLALRDAAAEPTLSDEFISGISDPRMRGRLGFLARRLPNSADRQRAPRLLEQVAALSVLPIKQEALDRANEYGTVITTVFLVLGLFSLAAAVLLLFLIFALLAADRSVELATMRALGMRRRQIMRMFLFEGMVYNLVGAALGTLLSIGTAYGISRALAQGLSQFGIAVVPYVDPQSLALTSLGGVLLIFVAMLVAVRRVSRLEIVAATRGDMSGVRPASYLSWGLGLWGLAGFVWWQWRNPAVVYAARHPLVVPITCSLVLLGSAGCLLALIHTRKLQRPQLVQSGLVTLVGLGLSTIWLRTLAQLPTPSGTLQDAAVTLVVAGCVLLPTSVWTVSQGLGPALKLLDRSLGRFARLRAVVRPAAGYLAQGRGRTALTVVMFGMVMFMMVLALVLIQVVVNAYAPTEAPVAGFDLRAEVQRGTIPDINAALLNAPAIRRDAFGAVGGVAEQEVQFVQLGLPQASWQAGSLAIVDEGFLSGIQAGMEHWAANYADARSVWAALQTQPGTAVVTAEMLRNGLALPQATTDDSLVPFTIWARSASDGQPIKLRVIGIVSGRSELDAGIYTSRTTAAGFGTALPDATTYLFATQPGVRVENAAAGLRVSFATEGLEVTVLGETLRIANAVRRVLIQVVQGFMGLGLIAGIAALGLLAVQAVIERRQQLGTLRALGFTRRQTRTLLLFESAVIAVLGIALGLGLGLVLARSLVSILADAYPEVRYTVPWSQIGLAAAVACTGAGLAITVATWEAGRVSPAEALRTV